MAQLITLISTAFQVKLSAATVYEAPTVAGLATLVEARRGRQQADVPAPAMTENRARAGASTQWLVCRRPRPAARYRLYCFPHSGGSAGEFMRWRDDLPEVAVLGVQLPGRGARLSDPAFTRMGPLVDAILAEVTFQEPFAFFGHSLGALVAFEVARALRATGRRQPNRLFASACPAPHLPRIDTPVHQLPDSELAAWIRAEYGSLPADIIENPELLRVVLPAHRADFELVNTYRYRPGEPLDLPFTVIGGTEDEVTEAELAGWRAGARTPPRVGTRTTARRPLLPSRTAGSTATPRE